MPRKYPLPPRDFSIKKAPLKRLTYAVHMVMMAEEIAETINLAREEDPQAKGKLCSIGPSSTMGLKHVLLTATSV